MTFRVESYIYKIYDCFLNIANSNTEFLMEQIGGQADVEQNGRLG